MKRLLLLFCGLMLLMNLYAQDKESKMKYVYGMDEALQKASKENKLIFFNCYADWVITCHSMDKLVFSDQKFANFMDKNFVNLFIDVSQGENDAIAKRYNIEFFAHYLVLDAKGNVVHRILGGDGLPRFQNNIALALNPKTSLKGMNIRYTNGEASPKFYREYLNVLRLAGETQKYDSVFIQYVSKIDKKDWSKSYNWNIFTKRLRDKDSEYFQFLLDNKSDFVKNNGEKKVNELISNSYYTDALNYALDNTEITADGLADMQMKFNKANLYDDDLCRLLLSIAEMRFNKQYSEMITSLKNDFGDGRKTLIDNINYSFEKVRDASPVQKDEMIEYLTSLLPSKKGSVLNQYKWVISQLKDFVGIEFFAGSFTQAMAEAKAEDRLIFLDAYTTWCAPCISMSSHVFTKKEVGNMFNQKFINVKIDMEKGEGLELAERYDIRSFPTFLLIDGYGNVVHKVIGGSDATSFMKKIGRGEIKESSYSYLVNNLDTIKKHPELYVNYLIAKSDALEIDNVELSIADYLNAILKSGVAGAKDKINTLLEHVTKSLSAEQAESVRSYINM